MKKYALAVLDIVFPYAGGASAEPPDRIVTTGRLGKDAAFALETAIRLHDTEVRRRQTADTKAALYLAFLAAVLPVIGTVTPTVSSRFQRPVLILDIVLLVIALLYIFMAGWYAARATAPGVVHTIGEGDLSDALLDGDARTIMAERLIEATRRNYPLNNKKITFVRLTQAYIFRVFVTIMLVVAIDWGTPALTGLSNERQEIKATALQRFCSPLSLPLPADGAFGDRTLRYRPLEPTSAPPCLPLSVAAEGTSN